MKLAKPQSNRSTYAAYAALLREEPKIRGYLVATFVDALGIAASIWAAQLIMAQVFVDQRTRASLVIPTLVSSLAGTILAGPLADWHARRADLRALARWRWRLVILARVVETVALATLLPALAKGKPTVTGLLPYFVISSFLKMALGSTRVALEVDLLSVEQVQTDDNGEVRRDERGAALTFKPHLLSLSTMLGGLNGLAAMGGLLLGNRIIGLTNGRYWPLFAFDIVTNSAFIVILYWRCHPDGRAGRLGDLFGSERTTSAAGRARKAGKEGGEGALSALRDFWRSFVEVFWFLRQRGQRVLLWVMTAAWLIELFGEFYDDKMIMKQLLGATNEQLWRAEIGWSVAALAPSFVLPALSRRVGRLGRFLVITLLIDAAVIAVAGRFAESATLLVPFSVALACDRGLTVSSKTLVAFIQNSASSAAIRGRLAAVFGIVVLVSNIGVQSIATVVSERVGIPHMMMLVGLTMMLFVLTVAFAGGSRLWRFGLHPRNADSVRPPTGP